MLNRLNSSVDILFTDMFLLTSYLMRNIDPILLYGSPNNNRQYVKHNRHLLKKDAAKLSLPSARHAQFSS